MTCWPNRRKPKPDRVAQSNSVRYIEGMKFVAVNLTTEARDALRGLSFSLTGQAGRRVTLSEAMIAACRLAENDSPAAAGFLPRKEG